MILHIVTLSQATPGALCEETHYLHQHFIVLRKTEAMTLRRRCAMAARCGGDVAESDGKGKRGGISQEVYASISRQLSLGAAQR